MFTSTEGVRRSHNYPAPAFQPSVGDSPEDGVEGAGAEQSIGIDGFALVSLGGPSGAVAIFDLALDNAWPQRPPVDIVGSIDLAWEVAERQQLIAHPADLPKQFVRQFTIGRRGEVGVEVADPLAPSAFMGGGGQRGDVSGELNGTIAPEFESHASKFVAVLLDKAPCDRDGPGRSGGGAHALAGRTNVRISLVSDWVPAMVSPTTWAARLNMAVRTTASDP